MSHTCSDPACGCGHDHAATGPRFEVARTPAQWRPRNYVRPLSIGIFTRDDQILAAPVYDDAGQIKGWRPLGGEIEPGERARDTLIREIREETGQEIGAIEHIGVLENLYDHEGTAGHEIVFVYRAQFCETAVYDADLLAYRDGADNREDAAKWISLARARAGRVALYPEGLAELLNRKKDAE
jgi:ADP-ribose pyrophosphatase YjhB (NUDIX family)